MSKLILISMICAKTEALKNFLRSIGVFVFGAFFMLIAHHSVAFNLTDKAEISVITCSPGNEMYSVYGHSAIRVRDPLLRYDKAFNYGIFDFSSSNFFFRFAKGQTDYLLGATDFERFVNEYVHDKRSVFEQVLNLSQDEKQAVLDFLIWNAQPENRVYRYNFFFDNCATRVRDVIEDNTGGGLFYTDNSSGKTFRQLIKDYHGKLVWLDFGIDFLVAADADRIATLNEEMFLPDYVMSHFKLAKRADNGEPLVKRSGLVYQAPANDPANIPGPFVVFSLFFMIVLILTMRQVRKQNLSRALDILLYGITGFGGVFVSWFVLYSEHPAMHPNYNLLWLFPVNFLFALALTRKKWRHTFRFYHIFISVWMVLFVAISSFLPQTFHTVFYLIIGMLLIRSIVHSAEIIKELRYRSVSE